MGGWAWRVYAIFHFDPSMERRFFSESGPMPPDVTVLSELGLRELGELWPEGSSCVEPNCRIW